MLKHLLNQTLAVVYSHSEILVLLQDVDDLILQSQVLLHLWAGGAERVRRKRRNRHGGRFQGGPTRASICCSFLLCSCTRSLFISITNTRDSCSDSQNAPGLPCAWRGHGGWRTTTIPFCMQVEAMVHTLCTSTHLSIPLQVLLERRLLHPPLQLVVNLQVCCQRLHFSLHGERESGQSVSMLPSSPDAARLARFYLQDILCSLKLSCQFGFLSLVSLLQLCRQRKATFLPEKREQSEDLLCRNVLQL